MKKRIESGYTEGMAKRRIEEGGFGRNIEKEDRKRRGRNDEEADRKRKG